MIHLVIKDLPDERVVWHHHSAWPEERLQVVGQLAAARVAWVHRDVHRATGDQPLGAMLIDIMQLFITYYIISVLYCMIFYYMLLYYIILYCIISYYIISYYITLYYIVLYYIIVY